MINQLKSFLSKRQKIVLLGFGKEGRSTYKLIRRLFPNLILGIADSNTSLIADEVLIDDPNVVLYLGDDYQSSLSNFDLIIKSPGVKILDMALGLEDKISSQTDLFLQCYSTQTIGVTGTKGKSTTVSLIKHFIDAAGKSSVLIGNIGVPAFDMLDSIDNKTIVVYELSAHQLEFVHCSPHIAVLLNIYPEHLDYFDSFEAYSDAKKNIYKFQKSDDILIINDLLLENIQASGIRSVSMEKQMFDIDKSPLQGKHNRYNIEIALHAVQSAGVNSDIALSSLDSFVGLRHRLEYIGEYGGVRFTNDSISTVPESTIAAVSALGDVDILILGGYDRGLVYDEMIDFLIISKVKMLIFLGKAGARMYNGLINSDKQKFIAKDLSDVFNILSNKVGTESTCLLSPAAASYDQFKNFEHRGDIFTNLAKTFRK